MEVVEAQLQNLIDSVKYQYNKLVLVVGQQRTGKTTLLNTIGKKTNYPLINMNLELSRRMLELTKRQRSLKLPELLRELVDANDSDVVLFDNTELLFDIELQQDPLRLLQGSSRNRVVVASWTGFLHGKKLVYASPEHVEYKRYSIHDFQMLDINEIEE